MEIGPIRNQNLIFWPLANVSPLFQKKSRQKQLSATFSRETTTVESFSVETAVNLACHTVSAPPLVGTRPRPRKSEEQGQ
jgi:anthranilate/para-aminobenzoate synthase component I